MKTLCIKKALPGLNSGLKKCSMPGEATGMTMLQTLHPHHHHLLIRIPVMAEVDVDT